MRLWAVGLFALFPTRLPAWAEAVRDEEGNFTLKTVATALKSNQDVYDDRYPMK